MGPCLNNKMKWKTLGSWVPTETERERARPFPALPTRSESKPGWTGGEGSGLPVVSFRRLVSAACFRFHPWNWQERVSPPLSSVSCSYKTTSSRAADCKSHPTPAPSNRLSSSSRAPSIHQNPVDPTRSRNRRRSPAGNRERSRRAHTEGIHGEEDELVGAVVGGGTQALNHRYVLREYVESYCRQ